jgi:hypothetical protein
MWVNLQARWKGEEGTYQHSEDFRAQGVPVHYPFSRTHDVYY